MWLYTATLFHIVRKTCADGISLTFTLAWDTPYAFAEWSDSLSPRTFWAGRGPGCCSAPFWHGFMFAGR